MEGLLRYVCFAVLMATLATGCRVAAGDLKLTPTESTAEGQLLQNDSLPVVGPIPQSSHWHAAYVVRICDDVLEPFDSDADPLGIHSHNDGLMHIHPFFEESGYEAATLNHFADAMGFSITEGELVLPGGGAWRDGDLCNGVPGRVFVDRWSGPDPDSDVTRIFSGIEDIRYEADGELYQIGFAPADSPPVVPPSASQLSQVSNLAPLPDPWIEIGDVDAPVSFWLVDAVSPEPCAPGYVAERATYGSIRCFAPRTDPVMADTATSGARAVLFNRAPAVEIAMGAELRQLIVDGLTAAEGPIALAVEVDGFLVTAPLIERPPLGDRLIIAGGFSVESAQRLSDLVAG